MDSVAYLGSDFSQKQIDPGFKAYIKFLNTEFERGGDRPSLLLEFTDVYGQIITELASNYPANNIHEFDFASSYREILKITLGKEIPIDYLQFSYKWFVALLKHLNSMVPAVDEVKTINVVDYPADAFAYRGNIDTSFIESNAYYSYL
ncbi:MAG: hypothetical protein NT004_19170 [Bacteroidetes bacterium]|nr:hypothetical protein [Bacteroidota bacterium]